MIASMYFWKKKPLYRLLPEDEYDFEVVQPARRWNRLKRFLIITALTIGLIAAFILQFPLSESLLKSPCAEPRVRKEWRTLSTTEKREYIDAVQCLYIQPSKLFGAGSLADDFARVHYMSNFQIHYKNSFLLWHRYFILTYELMLRDTCGFAGSLPYWDWSLDWENPSDSPIWDANSGFGGDGQGEAVVRGSGCVSDGPFAGLSIRYFGNATRPHCLTRQFDFKGADFAPSVLEGLYHHDKLGEFSLDFEKHAHDAIPNGVGGDFSALTAPSDPVWFLHHSNIDRLFWKWQSQSRGRAVVGRLRMESTTMRNRLDAPMSMLGLTEDLPAYYVLDARSGDGSCYGPLPTSGCESGSRPDLPPFTGPNALAVWRRQ